MQRVHVGVRRLPYAAQITTVATAVAARILALGGRAGQEMAAQWLRGSFRRMPASWAYVREPSSARGTRNGADVPEPVTGPTCRSASRHLP